MVFLEKSTTILSEKSTTFTIFASSRMSYFTELTNTRLFLAYFAEVLMPAFISMCAVSYVIAVTFQEIISEICIFHFHECNFVDLLTPLLVRLTNAALEILAEVFHIAFVIDFFLTKMYLYKCPPIFRCLVCFLGQLV